MKYLAALLIAAGCATQKYDIYDYLVQTPSGTYLCDKLEHGAYGAAALDCEHVMNGTKVDMIPNPYGVTIIKEQ